VDALVLVAILAGLFALGAPMAVAIGVASLVAFLLQGDFSLMMVIQRLYAGADSFPLMAVPLFVLAGLLMEAGGLSQRIVRLAESLVGWLPGGLAAVSIVSAMFFAGITGSAAADTAAVGGILIPEMIRRGYGRGFSAAVQASGGSLGVVIPPSIPMIIFGFLTGASISELFAAGILPGLLIGASLVGVSVHVSRKAGYGSAGSFSAGELLGALWEAKWALGAPIVVLGGILGGVFTATESAAIAVFYAFAVGIGVHRELRWREIPSMIIRAALISSVVLFIIATASVFSWLMAIQEIPARIASWLQSISDSPRMLLFIINILLLIAGTFVETTAALILLAPVLVSLLPHLQIDLVQLGAIIIVNLSIGMLTPPLGICLIVASGIADSPLEKAVAQLAPFFIVLILDLMIITYWPPLTLWLPSLLRP
jgi:tripartite ATP-independent transporter DctM subunit